MVNSRTAPVASLGIDHSGLEITRGLEQDADLRRLRHLGFRRVTLPGGTEHHSIGPSYLHQLGYCAQGSVVFTVYRDFHQRQHFDLKAGDLFFLPAGSQFVFENIFSEQTTILFCSARDNFDILDENRYVTLVASPDRPDTGLLLQARSLQACGPTGPSPDIEDGDESHIVLFFDPPGAEIREVGTIAGLFSHTVVAREFGLSEIELPLLEFSLHDALVIAPIDREVPLQS
ncbi:cupin domain-containing protein [Rhizobium tubonense]|uniref:Uncharacterized protein n=1 Tax=Rhizobium tubonense TaxID=484088 RepID=A0A2W4C2J6_9HYPH|nr:cupin domain-containing protein [Rhizobium tubonense]PZM08039.1 hypothetical protein CPY51_30280 [Rhizobium tubonense]